MAIQYLERKTALVCLQIAQQSRSPHKASSIVARGSHQRAFTNIIIDGHFAKVVYIMRSTSKMRRMAIPFHLTLIVDIVWYAPENSQSETVRIVDVRPELYFFR